MLLKPKEDSSKKDEWNLLKNNLFKVREVFDIAKGILDSSDKEKVKEISVHIFDLWVPINRQTTREEFLLYIIGDVQCDSDTNFIR